MKIRFRSLFLVLLLLAGCTGASTLQNEQAGRTDTVQPVDYSTSSAVLFGESPDDSGMWLLPQIKGAVHAELSAKGLKLSPESIYDPSRSSLNQAIVRINIGDGGGGTGSFVSDRGLILTNHHVAYDAISSASSVEQNLLEEGFHAERQDEEIRAIDYSLYIPIEQKEVTDQIQSKLPGNLSNEERNQREQMIRNQLIWERKSSAADIVVEIDDYWAGNRQFMAVYKVIRDIRLVHAPPESIGKFGGDVDNWQWPRHTGDYAFLRAYVAPDGSGRAYHEDNVPFRPARHLSVNADGVRPGDFTMTLGFPATTYRYHSSHAFRYYHKIQHPVMMQSFKAVLDALEFAANQDPDRAVENASDRASTANTLKYLQAVQTGFDAHRIIQKKQELETAFQQWVMEDSLRAVQYGRVLSQLDQAFDIASQTGDLLYGTYYPLVNSSLLQIGNLYSSYYSYLDNPDSLDFSDGRKDSLLNQHQQILDSVHIEAENLMLNKMVYHLASFPPEKRMLHWIYLFNEQTGKALQSAVDAYIKQLTDQSLAYDPDKAKKLLDMPVGKAVQQEIDPMVTLFRELYQTFHFSQQNYAQHFRYLNPARKRYVEGMQSFRQDSTEYPDANFTLRLSGGRVMGYSPADGIYYPPFTTFAGMIAKDTDVDPFDAPQKLEDMMASKSSENSSFVPPRTRQIANLLTTNDITGGNSGSPLLNGNGEIVGLAFDSNYEGVIGDYYYVPELNRTINVDIRYVLFLLEEFSNAQRILNELDVIRG